MYSKRILRTVKHHESATSAILSYAFEDIIRFKMIAKQLTKLTLSLYHNSLMRIESRAIIRGQSLPYR